MATRRARSDSATAVIAAMKNAAAPDLAPPEFITLSPRAMPYFTAIVRARARAEWTELHLIVAGQLAECLNDIAEEETELLIEGRIIKNDRGTPIMNPRMAACEQLARKEMALMRTLQMGGRVAGGEGDARNKAGARRAEADARKVRDDVKKEGASLLAD